MERMKSSPEFYNDILDIEFKNDFAKQAGYERCQCCLREYLWGLLITLWREGEGFSGKRPFGNSSWDFDIYKALVAEGYVKGVVDEWGELASFDRVEADELVEQVIAHLFGLELEDSDGEHEGR